LRTDSLYLIPMDFPFAAEVPKGRWFRHLLPLEDIWLCIIRTNSVCMFRSVSISD